MLGFITARLKALRNLPSTISDYYELKKQLKGRTDFAISKLFLVLVDKTEDSGIISGFYFHQDLWAAQKIFKNNPEKHVDIGSRTDGFVAHVASFRKVEIFDIRPLTSKVENISYKQADLMKLPTGLENYTDSISSLSVIEHFGLGRYTDPIDVDGHLKGFENMYKILKKGGKCYFSVPVGPQRIEFNAHRVFSLSYLLKIFEEKYKVDTFAYIDDNGELHDNVELSEKNIQTNCGCTFANGLFELTKIG